MRRRTINPGCLIKLAVVLTILIGILFLINTCFGGSCIRRIDKSLPAADIAPYEIITPTHVYYAEDVVSNEGGVLITGWYEQLNGKWIEHETPKLLEYRIYGNIEVRGR